MIVAVIAPRVGRRAFLFAALAPAATVGWAIAHLDDVKDGGAVTEHRSWVPELGLDLTFRADAFSVLMLGIVGGIGVLVMIYASAYFDTPVSGLPRLAGLLVAFAGAMTGLVTADSLLLLFVFWELTSITSYGLIGFKDTSPAARTAALQALLITGGGGLVLLAGFVLLEAATGAGSLSELAAVEVEGTMASWAAVLILIGCFTKSAQVPFHAWLPGAMAAPTPVSAFLHSATMVKAGVFLIARLSPHLGDLPPWRPVAVSVGLATMVFGGWRALRQTDLKLLLAYGTVSQLGMLTATFGASTPKLLFAGTALLLAHAMFKASLFMLVGTIDHAAGTRDLHELAGVRQALPAVAVAALISGGSMAGLIPLAGFVAKEAAVVGFQGTGWGLEAAAVGVFIGASAFTVAYTMRFLWGAFTDAPDVEPHIHKPAWGLAGPGVLLAIPTVIGGFWAAGFDDIVSPAAGALNEKSSVYHLVLWPGFKSALFLSLLAVAVGAAMFAVRRPVERLQRQFAWPFEAVGVFEAMVRGLLHGSARVTRLMQSGSLPLYLAIIAVGTCAIPLLLVIDEVALPEDRTFASSGLQFAVVILSMICAAALALTNRRFIAVLLLGGVGFGSAAMFVIQGAPDLALTQVLVETVSLAVYVMVLRHLPARFRSTPLAGAGPVRLAVAAMVGVTVFMMATTSLAARTAVPVDEALATRAYSEGDGRNIVNVILVDFRGLDTVGEAIVLVTAALGAVALVLAGRDGHDDDNAGHEAELAS